MNVAIWNPVSGGAPDEDELISALRAADPGVELVETEENDPGTGQTRDAVERGARGVIACGGDGTVRACLEPLVHSDVALGIIPTGTGNLLASNLGLANRLEAASAATSGEPRTIDVGKINDEYFAVMAGSGFDAYMIRDANPETKRRFGTVAYVFSALRNLPVSLTRTRVEVDGREFFAGRTSMVLIGNFGTITGGLEIFPDADPADGRLDVAVLAADSIPNWLRVVWSLLRGTSQPHALVKRVQGEHIIVTTDDPRAYELDGEDREPVRRLEVRVVPDALVVRQGVEA